MMARSNHATLALGWGHTHAAAGDHVWWDDWANIGGLIRGHNRSLYFQMSGSQIFLPILSSARILAFSAGSLLFP
jgi:hypothetical protein